MLNKCILPLSLNESDSTINGAATFIKELGTKEIFLAHIFESDRKRRGKEEKLENVAKMLREMDFSVSTHGQNSNVTGGIRQLIFGLSPDYAALPWHYIDPFRRSLAGSKDLDIVRSIEIPSLVYKRKSRTSKSGMNAIVYATNFRETDKFIIPYLKKNFIKARSLYLFHVGERAPDPEADRRRRLEIEGRLQRIKEECRPNFDKVEIEQSTGSERTLIARHAKKKGADMIIIGKTDSNKGINKILGSIAESVILKASCSVFLVSASEHPGTGENNNG